MSRQPHWTAPRTRPPQDLADPRRASNGATRAAPFRDAPICSGLLDNGDFVDEPFVPPRFEFRRFGERVIANIAAVLLWTGVWNQIDDNALPLICSYNACGDCIKYGEFPCAWYKIGFILVGIAGMYVTRGLYCDHEVTYKQRRKAARCCGCGWTAPGGQTARR